MRSDSDDSLEDGFSEVEAVMSMSLRPPSLEDDTQSLGPKLSAEAMPTNGTDGLMAPSHQQQAKRRQSSVVPWDWRKYLLPMIVKYLRGMFTFPLVHEPISFSVPIDTVAATAESKPPGEVPQLNSDEVEDLCNFDKESKGIFENLLQERKDALAAKDKYHSQEIDVTQFPGWDDGVVKRLKSMFRIFDASDDGLIDFAELNTVLVEFGDKSPENTRRFHFNSVDFDKSGAIDFEEFLTMVYRLTHRIKSDFDVSSLLGEPEIDPDVNSTRLGETFRLIDRNLSRILNMDVVQQLQAGLF